MRLAKTPNDTLFLRNASSARLRLLVTAATVCAVFSATGLAAQEFQYDPIGQLIPGSGVGRVDSRVYVPGMRFPVESAPAYANSQVYRPGGNKYDRQLFPNGKGQCDARNFAYPWGDNYCEIRGWTMPRCPAGTGHQGQDIRGSSCADNTHWVVAAEDGVITSIKSISVYLMNNVGTVRYNTWCGGAWGTAADVTGLTGFSTGTGAVVVTSTRWSEEHSRIAVIASDGNSKIAKANIWSGTG